VSRDKSTWPAGPWHDEPDHEEWRHLDFPCLIHRGSATGALCGYVAVPAGHPWHGQDFGAFDVDVHGGLTYAQRCQDGGPICHVPKPGEADDVWWVGFDCNHLYDIAPGYLRANEAAGVGTEFFARYRDIRYVRHEVEELALQAQQAADAHRPPSTLLEFAADLTRAHAAAVREGIA
jgi:hypothetical protein